MTVVNRCRIVALFILFEGVLFLTARLRLIGWTRIYDNFGEGHRNQRDAHDRARFRTKRHTNWLQHVVPYSFRTRNVCLSSAGLRSFQVYEVVRICMVAS